MSKDGQTEKAMRLPFDSHEPLHELSCPWNQPQDRQQSK